ncbi:MAG: hypothetical protein ACOCYW_03560, partial [Roseicyclus sp.]
SASCIAPSIGASRLFNDLATKNGFSDFSDCPGLSGKNPGGFHGVVWEKSGRLSRGFLSEFIFVGAGRIVPNSARARALLCGARCDLIAYCNHIADFTENFPADPSNQVVF